MDPSLIDVNHPECDPASGGNWIYVFCGDDDYPSDPGSKFDFQHCSGPDDNTAGQMHQHDL